jgi:hypothetical protein
MKKSIWNYSLMIIGFLLLVTVGCKKDEASTSGSYHFDCKIDGMSFAVTNHLSDIDAGGANIGGVQISVQNQKASSFNVYAKDLGTKGAADYTLTIYDVTYVDENLVSWHWKSGSLTITKFDSAKSEVTGTFTSIVLESDAGLTKTVTNGSFFEHLIK